MLFITKCQQVQLPLAMLYLVLELAQSTWTMLTVLAVKVTSSTANISPMFIAGMVTMRMLE